MQPTAQTHPILLLLTAHKEAAAKEFEKRHAHAQQWLLEQGLTLDQIRSHSAKLLTGATLGSTLLLASPKLPIVGIASEVIKTVQSQDFLQNLINTSGQPLTTDFEADITNQIQQLYGVRTSFELDHNRLPTYFGKIGLEQHLYRFPQDSPSSHDAYQDAGIAPLRGAFGYFARSGVTQQQTIQEEKYYIVLQTFLIPEWNTQWATLKPWYAFRKFLVINPETGAAVVAVLGDSGPAVWTGKQFGGSPEVMAELGLYPTKTKGDVVVLFLDDPANEIPLGSVSGKGVI